MEQVDVDWIWEREAPGWMRNCARAVLGSRLVAFSRDRVDGVCDDTNLRPEQLLLGMDI